MDFSILAVRRGRVVGFLARLLPYRRVIAVVLVLIIGIAGALYIRNLWIDAEIARRSNEQTRQQLDAVTKDFEAEKNRRKKAEDRIDRAAKEAAESDDAQDPAPDSTRDLLNSLYGE